MPKVSTQVIPYIFYRDVPAALDWLARAFGFVETYRHKTEHGMHAEMMLDGQKIMMGQAGEQWRMLSPAEAKAATQGVFIYLAEVDAQHERARAVGAEILQAPHDVDYGRTYMCRDLDGHPWFFTVPPAEA